MLFPIFNWHFFLGVKGNQAFRQSDKDNAFSMGFQFNVEANIVIGFWESNIANKSEQTLLSFIQLFIANS